MYKPVRLDAQGRAVRLGVQGKAEQQLVGVERLGGAERRLGGSEQRLGGAGEAELLGAQGKVEQRLGRAEWLLGGVGQRFGSGGLAERERRRSFVERQSFWVFPLQLPPFQNCIDPMQMVEVE